jgi:hypothetical protein
MVALTGMFHKAAVENADEIMTQEKRLWMVHMALMTVWIQTIAMTTSTTWVKVEWACTATP